MANFTVDGLFILIFFTILSTFCQQFENSVALFVKMQLKGLSVILVSNGVRWCKAVGVIVEKCVLKILLHLMHILEISQLFVRKHPSPA